MPGTDFPKNAPKITIVTPTFNQGAFIEKTILSILDQKYPNLEYIIMDGGSTDETVSIIKKYESQITYWESVKDNGQSHAINKGLERSTGEIFNWINSDDWLEPGALKTIGELWSAGEPHIVAGATYNVYPDGERVYWGPAAPTRLSAFLRTAPKMPHAQPSTFIKTALLKSLGGVRDDLHFRMDWDLYLRCYLLLKNKLEILITPDALTSQLQHPQTKTSLLGHKFDDEAKKIFNEYTSQLGLTEKLSVRRFLSRDKIQNEIVNRGKSQSPILNLLGLGLKNPKSLLYRFYWGALRRASIGSDI